MSEQRKFPLVYQSVNGVAKNVYTGQKFRHMSIEAVSEEVDVGVGIIYGPWGCGVCGWSDDPYYDCSDGKTSAQREYPNHKIDQFGGATPK